MKSLRKKIYDLYYEKHSQYSIFFSLSFIVFVITLVFYCLDIAPFHRFIGNIDPLIAIILSFILGLFLLSYLITRTSFSIYCNNKLTDYLFISGIAILFGIEIIIADIWVADYSAEINIAFPQSILFYPIMGYIVEIFFHILPLSVIIVILSSFKKVSTNNIIWISIFTVALLEPVYQVLFTSHNSQITSIYTGIHVLLFSLAQLIIFKRYDFLSMYYFRIVFYLIWHILWGHLRIDMLFKN